MKLISILLSVCMFVSPMAQAGPALKPAPMSHFQAVAVRNLLHDSQTVGGFLRWLEIGHPKAEVAKLRRWLMKHNIAEDQFFPAYQTKGNTISYGRARLSFHDGYVVINKKRYNYNPKQSLTVFLDKVCKDIKCGSRNAMNFDSLIFNEAEALATILWVGLGFLGGFIVGRYGWPWQWFRRRPVQEQVTTFWGTPAGTAVAEGVTAVGVQEVVNAVKGGGVPKCEGEKLVMCGASSRNFWGGQRQNGCEAVPGGGLDDDLSCKEEVTMITRTAIGGDNSVNPNKLPEGAVRADGSRSGASVNPKPQKKKKPWERRNRWH